MTKEVAEQIRYGLQSIGEGFAHGCFYLSVAAVLVALFLIFDK